MGTLVAQDTIVRAQTLIQDITGVRWLDSELLNYLNDGQREVANLKPSATAVNTTVALIAGTKQSIPANGVSLIDVIRNVVATLPSKAVTLIDRNVLDTQVRGWHSQAAAADGEVDHFIFDNRDPKSFYVYPQSPATPNSVDIVYSAAPVDVALLNATNVITIDDIYGNALLDYILYRAYSKDADFAGNVQRATMHYTAFMQSITGKMQAGTKYNPNNNDTFNRSVA
ncbi:MAG: DUF6682 family protein, partial [Ghiorsea sp.]